jgi:3-hydroxyacyl-CoA dehydrogenase
VVGLHFFSPANVMRLLEVVRSKHTAKDVMATVMAVAKKIKKVAVVSGVCDGFIGNRMFEQYVRQSFLLLEEGATVQQVDKAAEAFGWAMGPFRVGDLAGNDIGFAIRKRRRQEQPDVQYSPVGDAICELGRFGQKVGKGWYDYEVGKREPVPSAEVQACIDKVRADKGLTPRAISDEEIVDRLMLALANEGAHILAEGIASKASDIDMVYLTGYGFPVYRGGPMLFADMMGLDQVVAKMAKFAANPLDDATFWQPAPNLAKLAAEGKTFTNQA